MTEGVPTNADLARRGFELWNERRIDEVLELFHADAVWDMTPFGVPDRAVSAGHEAIRRFFDEWMATFPDSTVEAEEVLERGRWTLTVALQTVSGRSSGTPVPFHYGGIGRWREGRLELVENHPDLDRAREAFDRYSDGDSAL